MAATFLNFVGSFFIRELTGDRREIKLSGRALPYPPYTLEGEHDVELTWYAGNPIATAQPLGARERDTMIRGWWKDRFIGDTVDLVTPGLGNETRQTAEVDGQPIQTVRDLAELIDDVRRKGQLIEVFWLQTARRGFLQRFTQTWHTARDLEWSIAFRWISQAEEQPLQLVARDVDLSDISVSTAARFTELENIAPPAYGAPIDVEFFDGINARIDRMRAATLDMADTVNGYVDRVLEPIDTARRILGTLQFLSSTADDLILDTNARVDRTRIGIQQLDLTPDLPFGAVIRAGSANRAMVRAARALRHDSHRSSLRVARSIDPDLITTVFARAGQDLRDISTDHYGTPDEHVRLRRFNNLRTSELVAGQVVLVPERGGGF